MTIGKTGKDRSSGQIDHVGVTADRIPHVAQIANSENLLVADGDRLRRADTVSDEVRVHKDPTSHHLGFGSIIGFRRG